MLYGGIEAGGTKFVCAVGDGEGNITERIQIPTTEPAETMEEVLRFFGKYPVKAIGVGSFGPVDLNPESPTYGYITTTPKKAWRNFPFVKTLEESFGVPVGFTTDVNAAALGENILGAARGLDSCLYITVGTGIGAGAIVNGEFLQGLSHPEMGHLLVQRHPRDPFRGKCPYHHDCLEGLAAGPAIEERWGKKGKELSDREEVWEMEAYYLAQAVMQYILILSPKKIIMGGGVMKQSQVFPLIHQYVRQFLNGYVNVPELTDRIEAYIVPPGLKDHSGITGALLLGKRAGDSR